MVQRFEMLQKQTQQMVLSPQMLQAINMLQMPLMQLQSLIRQEITTNPVLEERTETNSPVDPPAESDTGERESQLEFKEEFNILKKLDDEWKDYFSQSGTFRKFTQQDEERRRFLMDSVTSSETLQEHLLKQLGIFVTDEDRKKLGEFIIGNIDNNGYLRTDVEDLSKESKMPVSDIEDTIRLIQTFNPIGICARNLSECLKIQLERLGKNHGIEIRIVETCLDLVAGRKYKEIAEKLNTDVREVESAVSVITTLDPKPGAIFSHENLQYIRPDVFVEKVNDEYTVTLNDESIPHLYISRLYRSLMQKKDTRPETLAYIKQKISSGNWLIKNIHQRQQTIYKIALEIVNVQREFMDEGPIFLKPLTMQELANSVHLHESTISRAIANKYMQTPQGTFQMKYFFSSGIRTLSGEQISVKNIKERIAVMIKDENPKGILSDQDIIDRLAAEGIMIARRTIAKYRQDMGIPASTLRKKL